MTYLQGLGVWGFASEEFGNKEYTFYTMVRYTLNLINHKTPVKIKAMLGSSVDFYGKLNMTIFIFN